MQQIKQLHLTDMILHIIVLPYKIFILCIPYQMETQLTFSIYQIYLEFPIRVSISYVKTQISVWRCIGISTELAYGNRSYVKLQFYVFIYIYT